MDIRNYFSSKKKEGAGGSGGSGTTRTKENGGDSQKISNPFAPSKNLNRASSRMEAAEKEQVSPNLARQAGKQMISGASTSTLTKPSSKESHQSTSGTRAAANSQKSKASKRNKVAKNPSTAAIPPPKNLQEVGVAASLANTEQSAQDTRITSKKGRKKRNYGEFLADKEPAAAEHITEGKEPVKNGVESKKGASEVQEPSQITWNSLKSNKEKIEDGKKKLKIEQGVSQEKEDVVLDVQKNQSQQAKNGDKAQKGRISQSDDLDLDVEDLEDLVIESQQMDIQDEDDEEVKPQTRKNRRKILSQEDQEVPGAKQEAAASQQKEALKQPTLAPKAAFQGIDDVPSDAFEGLNFVVSGVFDSITREKVEAFIISKGGLNKSAVSGKTNYLIVGSKLEDGREVTQGTKYKKALEKNIPILNEEEFEEWVRKRTQLKNFQFCIRHQILQEISQIEQKQTGQENQLNKAGSQKAKEASQNDKGNHIIRNVEMWTDKYKPCKINDIVGNKGQVSSLFEFLRDWDDVHIRGNKKEIPASRGFNRGGWANAPRLNAKSALVSGPPGIGKTSACRIICNILGFEVLEMNASDCRNKLQIQSTVSLAAGNTSIDYWTVAGQKKQQMAQGNSLQQAFGGQLHKKSVIIMDECDGVGNGDRGGLQALLQVIKQTKAPIICICNDRQSDKVQSIANHSLDVKFQRPNKNEITRRIQQIAYTEGVQIDNQQLSQLIESSGNDIRQIINIMQMWQTQLRQNPMLELSSMMKDEKVMINNFDAASRLLNQGNDQVSSKYRTYRDKQDLFFIDYDFVPSLVQENYLGSFGEYRQHEMVDIEKMAEAADMISQGDLLNVQIRQNQNWSLLPDYGSMSSVAPTMLIKGTIGYPAFPQALGKFSTMRKSKRLSKEVKQSLSTMACGNSAISASRMAVQTEIVPLLLQTIITHLQKSEIAEVVELLNDIKLTNDMVKEHLVTLSLNKALTDQLDKIPTQTKSAFTRAYNKAHARSQISKSGGRAAKGGAKGHAGGESETDSGEDQSEEEEVMDAGLMDEEQIKEIKKARAAEKEIKKQQKLLKKLEEKDSQHTATTGAGVSSTLQIIKKGGSQDSAPSKSKAAGKKATKGSQEDASMQDNISQEDAEAASAPKGKKKGPKTQQTKSGTSNINTSKAANKGKKNKTQKKKAKKEEQEDEDMDINYF